MQWEGVFGRELCGQRLGTKSVGTEAAEGKDVQGEKWVELEEPGWWKTKARSCTGGREGPEDQGE